MSLAFPITALVGYLLGALPFGYLMARSYGINIFEHGSRNPGATNVKRVLGEKFGSKGKRSGTIVFLLDACKGAVAAAVPTILVAAGIWESEQATQSLNIVGLVAALVGHSFSCFTRFKGGKGVATSAGGLVFLMPMPAALGLVTWVIVFQISRYVSLASIAASVVIPAATFIKPFPTSLRVLAILMGIFVIVRHRTNIVRLLNGTENRFTKKATSTNNAQS